MVRARRMAACQGLDLYRAHSLKDLGDVFWTPLRKLFFGYAGTRDEFYFVWTLVHISCTHALSVTLATHGSASLSLSGTHSNRLLVSLAPELQHHKLLCSTCTFWHMFSHWVRKQTHFYCLTLPTRKTFHLSLTYWDPGWSTTPVPPSGTMIRVPHNLRKAELVMWRRTAFYQQHAEASLITSCFSHPYLSSTVKLIFSMNLAMSNFCFLSGLWYRTSSKRTILK